MSWQTLQPLSSLGQRPPLGRGAAMELVQRSPLGRWTPSVPSSRGKGRPTTPALGFRRAPLIQPQVSPSDNRRPLWPQSFDLLNLNRPNSASDQPEFQARNLPTSINASLTPETDSAAQIKTAPIPQDSPSTNLPTLPVSSAVTRSLPTPPLAARHQNPLGNFRATPPLTQRLPVAATEDSPNLSKQGEDTHETAVARPLIQPENPKFVATPLGTTEPEPLIVQPAESATSPVEQPIEQPADAIAIPTTEEPHQPTLTTENQETLPIPVTPAIQRRSIQPPSDREPPSSPETTADPQRPMPSAGGLAALSINDTTENPSQSDPVLGESELPSTPEATTAQQQSEPIAQQQTLVQRTAAPTADIQEPQLSLETVEAQQQSTPAVAAPETRLSPDTTAVQQPSTSSADIQESPASPETTAVQQWADPAVDAQESPSTVETPEKPRRLAPTIEKQETQSSNDTAAVQLQSDPVAHIHETPPTPEAKVSQRRLALAVEASATPQPVAKTDVQQHLVPDVEAPAMPQSVAETVNVQQRPIPDVEAPETRSISETTAEDQKSDSDNGIQELQSIPEAIAAHRRPDADDGQENPSIIATEAIQRRTTSHDASQSTPLKSDTAKVLQQSGRVDDRQRILPITGIDNVLPTTSPDSSLPLARQLDKVPKPPLGGWRFLRPRKSLTSAKQPPALTDVSEAVMYREVDRDRTPSSGLIHPQSPSPPTVARKSSDATPSEPWQQQFQLRARFSQQSTDPWQSQFNLESPASSRGTEPTQADTDPIAVTPTPTAHKPDPDSTLASPHQEQDAAPVIQLRSPLSSQAQSTSDAAAQKITEAQIEELARICYLSLRSRLSQAQESYYGTSDSLLPWFDVAIAPTQGHEQSKGVRTIEMTHIQAITLQRDPKVQALVDAVTALVTYRLQTDRERSPNFYLTHF